MDPTFLITTSITILLALFGYLFTWFSGRRAQQQRDQLERINNQLEKLYGPLFALVQSSDMSWRAFRVQYQPNSRYFSDLNPPSDADLNAWRLWMRTVFMPINLQMVDIIQSNAHLLIEPEMPECLLVLQAHVSSFKAVIRAWDLDDFSDHESQVHYPSKELLDYVTQAYKKLKSDQAKLIGLLDG